MSEVGNLGENPRGDPKFLVDLTRNNLNGKKNAYVQSEFRSCQVVEDFTRNSDVCDLKCRETVPNHTSGKIKLTPPAYSHTTVLLISSLNFGLLTRG